MKHLLSRLILVFALVVVVTGCGGAPQATSGASAGTAVVTSGSAASGATKLTLGGYTTPREAYARIIPLFKDQWKKQTGQDLTFDESYLGSGAQARAIIQGFEADIAALSLESDINTITKAGLITHDWQSGPQKGIVSTSLVVFAVRKGNPKGIKDWADLAKPGLEILTPDPKTSGGAQWNILALYGAAKRGFVDGVKKDDDAAATDFLKAVLKNVTVMDKGARESITNFEKGVGDVAITYENEVLLGQKSGKDYQMVTPRSTILIQSPVAVVDTYADKHGTRAVAEAFVNFLYTRPVQEIFADYGFRSIDPDVAKATADRYPPVQDQWTIDYFGGWKTATPTFFGDNGVYSKAIVDVQK